MKQCLFILPLLLLHYFSFSQCNGNLNLDLYWIGGNGDFNDLSQWEVGSLGSGIHPCQLPRSDDNVFFMEAVFNGNGPTTITVNNNASCKNMYWENTILAADMPTLVSPVTTTVNTVNLDVYGSMELATNMDFKFAGRLRFRSTLNGTISITSRGQKFRLWNVTFDGSANTVFQLQDDFYVDDILERNHSGRNQGLVLLDGGTWDTNEKEVRVDYFNSINANAGRGLDLSNSVFNLHGSYPYAYHWRLNFNGVTGSNYTIFEAAGSKIHFHTYTGLSWSKIFEGGTALTYDTLVADAILSMRGGRQTFSHVELKENTSYSHDITLDVEDLYINPGRTYTFYYQKDSLIVGNIHVLPGCDEFVTFNSRIETWSNTVGIIRKKTPGTLTTDRFILSDMECDTTGGRSYVSNNSLRIGSTDPWWVINPPGTGKDFYFRDRSGGQEWKDPTNWDIWNGTAFVPNVGGCLPTPVDDVYFDNLSFPNASKLLLVDTIATCHNMYWLPTVANGASMRLNYALKSYGSAFLDPDMTQVNGTSWTFYGTDPDTISTHGVRLWVSTYLQKYSDYQIIGDNDVTTIDFDARYLYCLQKSTLRTEDIQMNVAYLYLYNRMMENTQVHFLHNGARFYDYGYDTLSYTGNTTFHYDGNNPAGTVQSYAGTLPNVIGNCYVYFRNGVHRVKGDLLLNERASWYPLIHPTIYSRLLVQGTMPLYSGNMTLTAGKTYTFSPQATSYMNIAGSLTSIGDCQNFIQLKTENGDPIGLTIGDLAGSTIEYTYLQGWDNSANPTVTAVNSIDGGNNSNINFNSSGAGVTYYWRGDLNAPTNYVGDWNDASHWTTNPASLIGDSSCIPTLLDTVIFDNMSFSGTSNGCEISGNAYCKTLICRDDINLKSPTRGVGYLYVAESFHLDNNMTNYDYSGRIYFVGSGDINTNGTDLYSSVVYFDKKGGVWDLQNDLNLTNTKHVSYGSVFYYAGTLNTNDYEVSANVWVTAYSRSPMTWNFGTSTINIFGASNWGSYIFGGVYMDSLQVDGDSCTINLDNRAAGNRHYRMAPNKYPLLYPIHYKRINCLDTDNRNNLFGRTADYGYIKFDGDIYVAHDFSCDSVFFSGGHFYYLNQNIVITLNAPHGKILTNAGPGLFANIETFQSGQTSYFHKPYGSAFCLDYVKVKNNEGTKDPLGTVPAAYQVIHSLLKFETGANSDNINGTATGIWDFSLPVLVPPTISSDTLVDFCSFAETQFVPIALVGNSPYNISYTWTDNLGNTGMQTDTLVADDDGDDNTPYTYHAAFPSSGATTTTYNLELSTFRCGEEVPPVSTTIIATIPSPNALVVVQRTDTCTSYNDSRWLTFLDNVDERPILSIQDKVNAAETDSLASVALSVNFDPTVQYLGTVPHLQRHWVIEPENNHSANVRLYFTQEELDSLKAHTFHGATGLSFSPSTDIHVRKFDSGIIGVGPSSIIPHTVLSWNATNSEPFSTTAGIIGIQFNTPSFSAFILEPTNIALLSTELVEFTARGTAEQQVILDWRTEEEKDLAYCDIERSKDGYTFEKIGAVAALNNQKDNNAYTFLDETPYPSISYYRLRLVDTDGSSKYSPIRSVELDGVALMRIFPVPTDHHLTVSLSSSHESEVHVDLIDPLGRTAQTIHFQVAEGLNNLKIDIDLLSSGIYLLRLTDNKNHTQQRKFVVRK